VSLNDTVGVTRLGGTGPHRPQGSPGMTVVDVLGSVDDLADGMGGSAEAVTVAAIGPYRESRVRARGSEGDSSRRSCKGPKLRS